MKPAKNIVVRVEGGALIIEADVSEDDVISTMISSLESLINERIALRIAQASKQPLQGPKPCPAGF